MKINFEQNEKGNIIELSDHERKLIRSLLIKKEEEYNIVVESTFNTYDNDDYLYLWHLINTTDKIYKKQNIIGFPDIWREGYTSVPYIHLEVIDFYSSYILDKNGNDLNTIDDKNLKISSKGPFKSNDKVYYIIQVDKKLLSRYMNFICKFFYEINDERPEKLVFSTSNISILKPIFCTTGFKEYIGNKENVILEIFEYSLLVVLAHEFSHISNAHLLLKANDAEYVKDRDVSFCLETNADDTAIRLILSELLYRGPNNSGDYNLSLTYDEFVTEWSIKSFSAFIALTWAYQGEDRKWDSDTVKNYLESISNSHPLYQLRAFNVISRALNHIYAILNNEDTYLYRTKDEYGIDKDMADHISNKTIDMIRSFEYCLYYYKLPDREVSEKLFFQQLKSDEQTHLTIDTASPIPMLFGDKDAQDLNESIKQKWTDVKARLETFDPYSMLYKTI